MRWRPRKKKDKGGKGPKQDTRGWCMACDFARGRHPDHPRGERGCTCRHTNHKEPKKKE